MASEIYYNQTRITASATWTQVATPASGQEILVDVSIVNWTANANTVLVAIKSSSPSADTDAQWKYVLLKSPASGTDAGYEAGIEGLLIKDGDKLYVKSDQTDTRVLVEGFSEVVP